MAGRFQTFFSFTGKKSKTLCHPFIKAINLRRFIMLYSRNALNICSKTNIIYLSTRQRSTTMLTFIDESGYPRPTDSTKNPVLLGVCIHENDIKPMKYMKTQTERSQKHSLVFFLKPTLVAHFNTFWKCHYL